jgi:hypothetical protein
MSAQIASVQDKSYEAFVLMPTQSDSKGRERLPKIVAYLRGIFEDQRGTARFISREPDLSLPGCKHLPIQKTSGTVMSGRSYDCGIGGRDIARGRKSFIQTYARGSFFEHGSRVEHTISFARDLFFWLSSIPRLVLDYRRVQDRGKHIDCSTILQIPVFEIDTSKIAELASQQIALHAKLATTKPGHAHTVIQRQIEATDRQIDQLVYQLYGFNDAEIALVEQSSPPK